MAEFAGGGKPHPLYGVWIDEALKKNDINEMRQVLQEARKHFPTGPQPLYGVWIITASRKDRAARSCSNCSSRPKR